MFTGIIAAVGTLEAQQNKGSDRRLCIHTGKLPLADVHLGDSIAVSGVCLTVVEFSEAGFWADVSAETLARTTLGRWSHGERVNLEKALTPTTRLGGHLVSGHVDGIGTVTQRNHEGRSIRFQIQAPDALACFIAEKGSICVDGVSLTVNAVNGAIFDLNIVPHTLQETNMDALDVGTTVNLEVDVIARYLQRLLLGADAAKPTSAITAEFLAEHGFKAR